MARLLGHLKYVTCMHFHFFHTQMIYFLFFIFSGESIEEVNAELDNLDRKDNFFKPFSCNKIRFNNKSETILKISLHTAFIVLIFGYNLLDKELI